MHEANIRELEFRVHLLTDHSVSLSDLKKQFAFRNAWIIVLEGFSRAINKSSPSLKRSPGMWQMELDSARAAISWGEIVISDLGDMVCTGY